jgi:hypothetical protein
MPNMVALHPQYAIRYILVPFQCASRKGGEATPCGRLLRLGTVAPLD